MATYYISMSTPQLTKFDSPTDVQAVRTQGPLPEGAEAVSSGAGGHEVGRDVDEVLHVVRSQVFQLQEGNQQTSKTNQHC